MEILRDKDGSFIQLTLEPEPISYCQGYLNVEKFKKEGFWFDKRDGCWKREVKP